MHIFIRPEREADYKEIKKVVDLAFERKEEGELIERLRITNKYIIDLALVAEWQSQIVGHILFYPIHIKAGPRKITTLGLAPLSVLPDYQNQGIGKDLVWFGLSRAKELGYQSVIVMGHADYYPKFGFDRASSWQLQAPFEVPDESFFAKPLTENALQDCQGTVEYPKEFYQV